MNEELVAIALITKPRGIHGEVLANVLTDFPERFENLETVFLVKDDDERLKLEIERHFFQKKRIVLKLKGFDSIEEAENLRNAEICILESETVELEDDEYFDWELEECRVETVEGGKVGIVKEIFRAGESINLVVIDGKKDHMIPFVEAICPEVDIENKLIKVDLPEGLLEI